MKIDKGVIRHTANLARLDLTDDEVEKFTPQVKEILELFSKLDEVDTSNVKPSFQPVEVKDVLREDKAESGITSEDALSLTEHKKDGYFKGPKAV